MRQKLCRLFNTTHYMSFSFQFYYSNTNVCNFSQAKYRILKLIFLLLYNPKIYFLNPVTHLLFFILVWLMFLFCCYFLFQGVAVVSWQCSGIIFSGLRESLMVYQGSNQRRSHIRKHTAHCTSFQPYLSLLLKHSHPSGKNFGWHPISSQIINEFNKFYKCFYKL